MAVRASGLEPALRAEGPFTLFAPHDAAFVNLRVGEVQAWLADPQCALAAVLQCHVVPGKMMSTDMTDGMMLETVNGESLKVAVDEKDVLRVGAPRS